MNIIVLIDKFKGSISSIKLGKITKSILERKGHNVDYFPISDGGNGFLDTILHNKNVKKRYAYAHDALNNKKKVMYLMDNENVYIEVAKIIGINKENTFDIYNATTYGVGEVILNAIKKGGKNFFVGLGGSITNDGGKGMLNALGYEIINNKLVNNSSIDLSQYNFNVISDVTSPLLGNNGATYMFSRQKGAKEKDLIILENNMKEYCKIINEYTNIDYSNKQGAGAAGGLGFAFLSILKADYIDGIKFVLSYLKIDEIIDKYDLIITGEGKIDEQSLNGKIVFEILKRYNKKTLLLCGVSTISHDNLYSIVSSITDANNSMKRVSYYYKKLLESIKL